MEPLASIDPGETAKATMESCTRVPPRRFSMCAQIASEDLQRRKEDLLSTMNDTHPPETLLRPVHTHHDEIGDRHDGEVTRRNLELLFWASVGLGCMVAELQCSWDRASCVCTGGGDADPDEAVHPHDIPSPYHGSCVCRLQSQFWPEEILKGVAALSTIILLLRVLTYYTCQIQIERHNVHSFFGLSVEGISLRRVLSFSGQHYKRWCLLELAVCAISVPPYMSRIPYGATILNDKVGLLMFMRLYLVIRVARDFTYIYRRRGDALRDSAVRKTRPQFNWRLALRSSFHFQAVSFVTGLVVGVMTVVAYCIYVLEREEQPTVFTFWNSFYFTGITMTTVGYGDVAPTSGGGRTLALVSALMGIILASLVTAIVIGKISLSAFQRYTVDQLMVAQLDEKERTLAACLIQLNWRYYLWRKKALSIASYAETKIVERKFICLCQLYVRKLRKIRRRRMEGFSGTATGMKAEVSKMSQRVASLETRLVYARSIEQKLQRNNAMLEEMLAVLLDAASSHITPPFKTKLPIRAPPAV